MTVGPERRLRLRQRSVPRSVCFCWEKLAQAVAEIEKIEAAGFPKASLKRFLKAPSPLFFGVFLLADWRERAAYRPFARLMRFPWVSHDNLLGEPALEEPGYRIMASLYDGDPRVIFDIILDGGADPSVHFWQWCALTLIALEGKLHRIVAADFAREAFGKLSRDEEESLIWSGWEKLVSRLALTDLAPLVRKAHDAELLVESTYEEFQGIWNTPSRILTLLVDRATSSKRLLASRSWSRGWNRDVRAWQSSPEAHTVYQFFRATRCVFFVSFVTEGFHSAAPYVRSVVST